MSLTHQCVARLREGVAFDLALTRIENNMRMGNTRGGVSKPVDVYTFCVGALDFNVCYKLSLKNSREADSGLD